MGNNNNTFNATLAMQACCLNVPIISLSDSCDIYCDAQNQTRLAYGTSTLALWREQRKYGRSTLSEG